MFACQKCLFVLSIQGIGMVRVVEREVCYGLGGHLEGASGCLGGWRLMMWRLLSTMTSGGSRWAMGSGRLACHWVCLSEKGREVD